MYFSMKLAALGLLNIAAYLIAPRMIMTAMTTGILNTLLAGDTWSGTAQNIMIAVNVMSILSMVVFAYHFWLMKKSNIDMWCFLLISVGNAWVFLTGIDSVRFGSLLIAVGLLWYYIKTAAEPGTVSGDALLTKVKSGLDGLKLPEVKKSASISTMADDLLKLKELLDAGIITEEEFDIKKNELLS